MTTGRGVISGASVSHDGASLDDLETVAVTGQREAVERLLRTEPVEEAYVLRTCNRVEAYVVTDEPDEGRAALAPLFDDVSGATVRTGHEGSLRHLMRVAAGLESLVLGEDQILGQVRDAYEDARAAGGIGPVLDEGVTKAIRVGERARTETGINEGVLSLGSAAVRLADREAAIDGETGLVVGAGEMATLAAKALAERVDRLLVVNRTVPHAEHVADSVPVAADAFGLDDLETAVDEARVVVSATGSPGPVFDVGTLADAGSTYVVDLAQPRDVPPRVEDGEPAVDGVTVRDLDDLQSVTEATRERRREAAVAVEGIVDEELDRLLTQYKRKRADRVISAMYESAERVKAAETETALSKLDLDEDGREVVESMADAIVSQLLAAPTESLRDAAEEDDWETINTALRLFDPNFGPEPDGPPAFVKAMDPDEIPDEMRDRMPAGVLEDIED